MAVAKNYDGGVDGSNYTPSYSSEFDMIGKVAIQTIRDIQTKNKLAEFEQYKVDNGDALEIAITKLVASTAYDPTGANTLTPDRTTKFAVRYYQDWNREVYKTTVDIPALRKELKSGKSAPEAAAKLVGALGLSDLNDKFQYTKALLDYGRTSSTFMDATLVDLGASTTFDLDTAQGRLDMLEEMKNCIQGMTYVNSLYNSATLARSTDIDDIRIIMPYKAKNRIDVQELSGIFNLDKAEINKRIIETDSSSNFVYIVDKHAVIVATRLQEMRNQENAEANVINYYYHVDRMYAVSGLFDGCYIPFSL